MLQSTTYWFLRPILRLYLMRVGRAVEKLPMPQDAPHAHASGANPDRILLFGSGPAVGYGVLSYELALPGQLARQLSVSTGKGVDIDVVADPDIMIQTAAAALGKLDLWRYDAIVLTVGANNALLLTSLRVWRKATEALFALLDSDLPERTRLVVVAIPPVRDTEIFGNMTSLLADRHAAILNRMTKRVASAVARITFVPFSPLITVDKTWYRSAATYRRWAGMIVPPLAKELTEIHRHEDEYSLSAGEDARQKALDDLHIVGTDPEERFDRIVRLACQMFDLPIATIAFVDHDRQWIKANVGFPVAEFPRAMVAGGFSIRNARAFVVEDTHNDPHFAKVPFVLGEPHIRFYAGYPISSALGEPIGIMAVYGRSPKVWTDADTRILRDLAIMVQREVLQ
jgi:GAF domain